MDLDKRIKALTDIQSVTNGCHDWEFMTKKGYFANTITDFQDLSSNCVYGEYDNYREQDKCFSCRVYLSNGTSNSYWFTYFIPEEDLKPEEPEKKYREFSLAEWIKQHEIGEVIHFRSKSDGIELCQMYIGYAHGIGKDITENNVGTITLGVASYNLYYLFERYEIEINGEWQPFGVLVKENE